MDVEPLEVYSNDSNFAVIKPPGRNFPGCVIQGDTLRGLCRRAVRAARRARDHQTLDADARADLEELANALVERLAHYQRVLHAHGIEPPYPDPVGEADFVQIEPGDDS